MNLRDLKLRGSQVMADDDTTLDIGQGLAVARKVTFTDPGGPVQARSDAAADSSTVTLTYRDSTGVILTEAHALTGTSWVSWAAAPARLLKAVLSAPATGNVALTGTTALLTGTLAAVTADGVTLGPEAPLLDQALRGAVLAVTSGTASGTLAEIVDFDAGTALCLTSQPLSPVPSGGDGYAVYAGMFFDRNDAVTEVRRAFYNAQADPDPTTGTTATYAEKCFWVNAGTSDLTAAVLKRGDDPSGAITFAVEGSVNDSSGIGITNTRRVTPALTFGTGDQPVPGGHLSAGVAIGAWLLWTLEAGAPEMSEVYFPVLSGTA